MKINTDNLEAEFVQQPTLYAEQIAAHAQAMKHSNNMKRDLELLVATLDKAVRDQAINEGRKITEVQVTHEITRDANYQTSSELADEAQRNLNLSQNTLEMLRQRKDMLIQLGNAKH